MTENGLGRRETLAAIGAVVGGGACCTPLGAAAADRDGGADQARPAPVDWETIEHEAYTVKYASGYESDAETIDDHMQYARDVVGDAFPHELSEPIDVELYPEAEYGRSQYSMGYFSSDRAVWMIAPSDNDAYDADDVWYKKNVVHEYVHVPQSDGRASGDQRLFLPGWFTEGHAEYVSVYRTTDAIRREYESYPAHDRILDQIRAGDGYLQTVTGRTYAGGKLIFRYLDDEYGLSAVADAFDGSSADNFTEAVESALGISPVELNTEWLRWAEANVGGSYDERLCAPADSTGSDDGGDAGGRRCGGIVAADGTVDFQGVLRAIRAYNGDETVIEDG